MKRFWSKLLLAAAAVFAALPAGADELPQRKAGFWELTTEVEGMPGASHRLKQCIDKATDAELLTLGKDITEKMGGRCEQNDIGREEGRYIHKADCMIGGSHVVSRTTFEGDFNKEYTATSITTYQPPMMGMSDTRATVTARFLGPCPEGVNPGDVVLADGRKMTLEAMRAMHRGM